MVGIGHKIPLIQITSLLSCSQSAPADWVGTALLQTQGCSYPSADSRWRSVGARSNDQLVIRTGRGSPRWVQDHRQGAGSDNDIIVGLGPGWIPDLGLLGQV